MKDEDPILEPEEDLKTDKGFILLSRSFIESSTWQGINTSRLAIWLMCKANHEPYEWFDKRQKKKILVGRGELITSTSKMAEGCNLTIKKARNALKSLTDHGFLTIINRAMVKGNGYSHVKLIKYNSYQDASNYEGIAEGHSKGQRWGKGRATIKEIYISKQLRIGEGPTSVSGTPLPDDFPNLPDREIPESVSKKKKRAPETEFPEGMERDPELMKLAAAAGFDPEMELESWKLKSIAHGWTYRNWRAAGKMWIRNAIKFRDERGERLPAKNGNGNGNRKVFIESIRHDRGFWRTREGAADCYLFEDLIRKGLTESEIKEHFGIDKPD